jgi:hypothetical protein
MAVIEKTINLNVDSKAAIKSVDGLSTSINDLSVGAADVEKSTGIASKGFKGLGTAMKAAGIGLIVSVLIGLKEVFSQNQKVVDVFSTAFETFSIVANQVVSAVINVYESVAKSSENFNGLGKVLGSLLKLGITPLKLGFYAIKLGLQVAQLAWEKSFFGDGDPSTIKALNEGINETKESLKEVGTDAIEAGKNIANNIGDAVGEIANIGKIASEELSKISISAAAEQAALNVKLKNSAELAAAQQSRLVEQYDLQAESLRQIRDEERLSITERKEANDNLLAVLDQQEAAMLKQADLQVAAAQNEVNKNNTIEAQVALIDALANKEGVLAQVQGLRSEQLANDLALSRESIELTNSKSEAESNLSIERQRFNAEQIDDELLKLEALKQIDLLYSEKEAQRLQAIIDNATAETQAKIDAQIALDEFTEQSRQTNLTNDIAISDKKTEIEATQKEIDDKATKAKEENLAKVGNALSSFSELAGKETAAGKALAIASTLIQTYQSAQSSYASLAGIPVVGPALGVAAAGAAVFAGMKQIQNIKKTKVPNGGGGASAGGGGSVGAAPTPPSFNVVGASETSALGDAVAGQANEPVQAYVVSNDVTTAQSLQNNIVDGATI